MTEEQFKERTRKLALRFIALVESLEKTGSAGVIGRQIVRSGTSIGANYRAACRARSRPDITAKLAIVEEEADETVYWLELLVESGLVPGKKLQPLIDETNEILAMTVASIKTLKRNLRSCGG